MQNSSEETKASSDELKTHIENELRSRKFEYTKRSEKHSQLIQLRQKLEKVIKDEMD